MKKKIILITFFITTVFWGLSQESVFDKIDVTNGLPTNVVYEVFKSNDGQLWFGNDKGVSRYDGYNFHDFFANNGKLKERVPDVFNIYQDYKNRIWLLGFEFLAYIEKDSVFYPPGHDKLRVWLSNRKEGTSKFLHRIYIDSSDNIYFYSSDSRHKVNLSVLTSEGDLKIKSMKFLPENKKKDSYFRIYRVNGSIKLINSSENNRYSRDSSIFNKFFISEKKEELKLYGRASNYRIYGDGSYLINSRREVVYTQNDSIIFRVSFSVDYPEINNAYFFNDVFYLCTKNGLYVIKRNKQGEYHLDRILLEEYFVTDMERTSDGTYWLTTLNNGIVKLYDFGIVKHEKFSNAIWIDTIPQLDDCFIRMANGSLLIVDEKLNIKRTFNSIDREIAVKNMVKTKQDGVFLTSGLKALNLNNGETYEYKNKIDSDKKYENVNLVDLFNDRYLAHWGADIHVFRLKNNIGYFDTVINIGKYNIKALIKIGESSVLVTSLGGTFILDLNDFSLTPVSHKTFKGYPKENNLFKNGYGDNKLLFLFSENVRGIVFDLKKRERVFLDGLDTNLAIIGIHKMNEDSLLIVSKGELGIFSYSSYKYEKMNSLSKAIHPYGLTSSSFNNERLLITTRTDLLEIDLSTPLINEHSEYILAITRIKTNDKTLKFGDTILLQKNEDNLNISFSALDFLDLNKINYEYRLMGYSEDWTETNYGEANFINLPPGEFNFELRAFLDKKLIATKSFVLIRAYKFHEVLWVQILFFLLVSVIVVFVFYRVIKSFVNRKTLQNRLYDLEFVAYQNQMNPHFTFNSLNSILSLIKLKKNEDAENYLIRFSNILRSVLDQSPGSFVNLFEEIKYLNDYLEMERMHSDKSFDFNFEFDDELEINRILIPQMILQPFVENAIIHGTKNKDNANVELIFSKEQNGVLIRIKDSGVPSTKEIKHFKLKRNKSIGIDNIVDRLNILEKRYNINAKYNYKDYDGGKLKGRVVTIFFEFNKYTFK